MMILGSKVANKKRVPEDIPGFAEIYHSGGI